MATLNTLRTKFGFVLSVIIAIALLAFIFSLRNEMGFSGNNPKVGEIAGDKITYSEYYDEYEFTKQMTGGNAAYDDASEERLAAETWYSLITRHAITPGFDAMGLTVSDAERISMLAGEHPSAVYYSYFANPQTGEYDVNMIGEVLEQMGNNPQLENIHAMAVRDRLFTKYAGLVRGGAYVNSLEVNAGVDHANKRFSGRVAGKSYASVPDSLFSVSSNEIKKYYNEHKNRFKQVPSRSISYVVFEVDPTQEDMNAIENEVREVADKFVEAEDVRSFVRQNRRGTVEQNFVSRAQLTADEAEALLNDKMYGPVLENDVWKMARVVASKNAPDSIGMRHVALPYNETALADSLLTALRNGGNIAAMAAEYSIMQTAADGGELGVMPFSVLPEEFAEALANAKVGDKVKVVAGNVIHVVDVYKVGAVTKHVNVARIEYPVEASSATKRAVHNAASTFAVNANGSVDKFHAAANEAAVTERAATINNGQRLVSGLDRSHEIVRWAYGTDKGDVSEIFNIGKDYVVAVLTDIDDSEYRSVASVQSEIQRELLNGKKFDHIVAGINGGTIEAVAGELETDASEFSNLAYAMYYVPGTRLIYEPRLVGAIASTEQTGTLSAPVKGSSGVYYFVVDEIAGNDEQTTEAEKVRLQSMAESMAQQVWAYAVQELAKVKDLRGRYF